MSTFSTVWVFSDAASRLPEIIAGAASLGQKVTALVIGTQSDVDAAFAAGAHEVQYLGEKQHIVEDYADTIASVINAGPKPALFLIAGTRCGKALASLVGVRVQAGVITEAAEVRQDGGNIVGKHMVFGGLALGEEKIVSDVAIVAVGSGVFAAGSPAPAAATGTAVNVPFVTPAQAVTRVQSLPKEGSSVDLSKAKRIVAVGRGISQESDLKALEELATALDAEMGCSRPIAEAEKWMGRERYIGISGVMPKPELYLALGISGQIQHMVGVTGAQTIVAVNKDKNAPIFEYADYGIVGDLYKVMPALTQALKG